jgi:hypothetical protein
MRAHVSCSQELAAALVLIAWGWLGFALSPCCLIAAALIALSLTLPRAPTAFFALPLTLPRAPRMFIALPLCYMSANSGYRAWGVERHQWYAK